MENVNAKDKTIPAPEAGTLEEAPRLDSLDYCTMPHDAESSRAWNPDEACDDCIR
jgi:hypothetical protein